MRPGRNAIECQVRNEATGFTRCYHRSLGAEADMMGYLVSRYFPRSIYGRVFGWQYAAFISCVGLSPLVLGYTRDIYGNYALGLGLCAALLVAAAGVFAILPRFRDVSAPPSQRTRS